MRRLFRYAGQFLFFVALAAFVGYFSNRPDYQQFSKDSAQIKLAFAHGAARLVDCRRLTTKEIALLPPMERRPNTCERERVPIYIQLILDGTLIYEDQLVAAGLARDGPGRTYQKFVVPAGTHTISLHLRDSKRTSGFDYEESRQIDLKPRQNFAIDFRADAGGFLFR